MRFATTEDIVYRGALSTESFTIPAGTPCIVSGPGLNFGRWDGSSGLKCWACPWEGISDSAASYARKHGFLLSRADAENRIEELTS